MPRITKSVRKLRKKTVDGYVYAVVTLHGKDNRLRHSRATNIREQYGLEAAQAVLGHSNADVTQIYAERDIATATKVMGEVG